MGFTLPDLPYQHHALEPHIDALTMNIHHSKHHQTYVNNLNAALEKFPEFQDLGLAEINKAVGTNKVPSDIATAGMLGEMRVYAFIGSLTGSLRGDHSCQSVRCACPLRVREYGLI